MEATRGVIVLSGGMDSGVLLASLHAKGLQMVALSFDYGAKHNRRELESAALLAQRYAAEHIVLKLPFLADLLDSSLLTGGPEIPEGSYNEVNMASTVVPFRNGIMLSVAVACADSRAIPAVYIGSHGGDHPVYPDCRPEFNAAMSAAAKAGTSHGVRIEAPFASLSKAKIAEIGRGLGFDFSATWTCYKGLSLHCGVCAACRERKSALEHDLRRDPTKYEQ